jgi:gamma-glutamyltranspeptidase/glutathione hydrolase
LIDHGLDPQEAVSAERFTVFPGSDADVLDQPDELRVEAPVSESILGALRDLGHHVVVQPSHGAGGSAQIISRNRDGILSGAADPRQEGVAIGVD